MDQHLKLKENVSLWILQTNIGIQIMLKRHNYNQLPVRGRNGGSVGEFADRWFARIFKPVKGPIISPASTTWCNEQTFASVMVRSWETTTEKHTFLHSRKFSVGISAKWELSIREIGVDKLGLGELRLNKKKMHFNPIEVLSQMWIIYLPFLFEWKKKKKPFQTLRNALHGRTVCDLLYETENEI
uniref:Uncharacterized protein n=1 Tax=Strigamia maritima TaxID=126957 RepID=T1JE14_STRMM